MIIDIDPATFGTHCECGEPAEPGLFTVQHLDGESDWAISAQEPMACCAACGDMADRPSERGYGVMVYRLAMPVGASV